LRVETLYDPDSGYVASSLFGDSGAIYLSVCSRGYCGGVGQISNDAQSTILRSTDGGVTWQALGTFDGSVSVALETQQGPLLNLSTFANGTTDYKFQLLGSSAIVRPPAGTEPAYSAYGRMVGWQKTGTNEFLKFDGSPLATLPDVDSDYPLRVESVLENGDLIVSWFKTHAPQQWYYYLGLVEGGQLTKVFRSDAAVNVGAGLNGNLVWGNVSVSPKDIDPANGNDGETLHPMWLDMHTGEVHVLELYGPAFSDAYIAQRNRIRQYNPGPFLRVTGAGDCLNVRTTEHDRTGRPVFRRQRPPAKSRAGATGGRHHLEEGRNAHREAGLGERGVPGGNALEPVAGALR
jgi:hypothetical protein